MSAPRSLRGVAAGPGADVDSALMFRERLLQDPAPTAAEIHDLVSARLEQVEALFRENLASPVRIVGEIGSFLAEGGGKRVRPALHLLAAVRGPGLLEVDANANPLREGLLQTLFAVEDGCVSLPGGQGLGLEPDLKPLANLRSLHIERHA